MIHAVSLFQVDSEAAGQFNLAAMAKHSLLLVRTLLYLPRKLKKLLA
jgi:hypothetical protein